MKPDSAPSGPRSSFEPVLWRWPANLRLHPAVWLMTLGVMLASWIWLPEGGFDWRRDIGPAARQWWPTPWRAGVNGLPLMPWAALLLSPLGGLPDRVATTVTNGLSVIVVALSLRRFGGPDWMALPVLATPIGYWLFRNGQTEWLMLTGLLFYNGLDVLVLILKPQVAAGVIVSRLRRAGAHWLAYLLPALIMGVVSLIIWPGWPVGILNFAPVLLSGEWNSSLWPWSMVVGLGCLWRAWQTGDDRWGVVATPFMFPYVNLPSYVGVLIVLAARWPKWFLLVWGLVWLGGLAMAALTFIR
jgi:hypothetical protein